MSAKQIEKVPNFEMGAKPENRTPTEENLEVVLDLNLEMVDSALISIDDEVEGMFGRLDKLRRFGKDITLEQRTKIENVIRQLQELLKK